MTNNTAAIQKNKLIFTEEQDKLNVLAAFYESIDSPRHLNQGTRLREIISNRMQAFKQEHILSEINNENAVIFSNTNPADTPNITSIGNKPQYVCTTRRLTEILKKLPNKTSYGTDEIPSIVLKHLPKKIVKELVILFNNSLNKNYFPNQWKTAKVIPFLKKGKPPEDSASYRPISLSPCLSKVFEVIINENLLQHTKKEKIVPDNQFGFKYKHSTVHAINKLMSDVNTNLTNNKLVGATLLDLEKAFDSVWLDGLIYILLKKRYPIQPIRLVYNMVHQKKFFVAHNDAMSAIYNIEEGLQQGTVNSPLLFLIHTSNVLNSFQLNSGNNTHSIAYADDLILYVAGDRSCGVRTILEELVNKTNDFYTTWNLKMNPTKCETILFETQ